MGREVRRVPATWHHPQNAQGALIPLYEDYTRRHTAWVEGKTHWDMGERDDYHGRWTSLTAEERAMSYEDWEGHEPQPRDYMPSWPEEQRTHYQLYENTSEGTPISPVCATPEELAQWLVDHHASFFAGMETDYQHWLEIIVRTEIGVPMFAAALPTGAAADPQHLP